MMKPIEQKQIDFQGGQITAVMVQDENGRENVYIPMKRLVEGMGLSWDGARQRIRRNPSLSKVAMSTVIINADIPEGSKRPKTSKVLCLPIGHINGFLFGIDVNKVKPELRELVIEYQDKCYEALFKAFNGTESMRRFYSAIGHEETWIEKRIEKHSSGTDLADIWLKNGISIEYQDHLLDIINQNAFGLTVIEHKQYKNLPEEADLHDNMTRVELLIALFGDEITRELIEDEQPSNLDEHDLIARAGGELAGDIRKLYEERMKRPILSKSNHLDKKKQLGE